jgi:hypothetical protein
MQLIKGLVIRTGVISSILSPPPDRLHGVEQQIPPLRFTPVGMTKGRAATKHAFGDKTDGHRTVCIEIRGIPPFA